MFSLLITLFLLVALLFYCSCRKKLFSLDKRMWFPAVADSLILSLSAGNIVWNVWDEKPEKFTDFIGGFLAMSAMGKSFEYYAFYTGLATFFAVFFILQKLCSKFAGNKKDIEDNRQIFLFSLIIPALMAGQIFFTSLFTLCIQISAISVVYGILATVTGCFFKKMQLREKGILLLALYFATASWFCISLYCNRTGINGNYVFIYIPVWFAGFYFALRKGYWSKFLVISQIGLPLAFSNLLPFLQILKNGKSFDPGYNNILSTTVMILILAGFLFLYFAFRKNSGETADFIPTLPLAALICMFCAVPDQWGSLTFDDYHNGEVVLPWFLFQKFGCNMYVDYIPSRGLVNYASGFFVWLFKGHDLSYIYNFYKWANLPLYILMLAVLRRRSSLLIATVGCSAMTCLTPYINAGLLLGICLWAWLSSPYWGKNPAGMLLTFFITGLLGAIYSLTDTVPVYVAMIPLAVYIFIVAWQQQRRKLLVVLLIMVLIMIFIMMIPVSRKMVLAALEVLILQSGSYTTAHCVPLMKHNTTGEILFNMFYIAVNYGFLLLTGIFAIRLFLPVKNSGTKDKIHYFSSAALVILGIILIQRAGGRAGCDISGRSAAATLVMLAGALPVWYLDMTRKKIKIQYLLIFLIFLGMYGNYAVSLDSLEKKYYGVIYEPENTVDPAGAGLPYMGKNTVLDAAHFKHHKELKTVRDSLLSETERSSRFWDLSNNSAVYAYCGEGMVPPMRYPSYFYVASIALAEKMREEIIAADPILVLIKGKNIEFHEGMLPLRTFPLYTWLLENYRVFGDVYGKIWMIRKKYEDRLHKSALVKPETLNDITLLSEALSDKHIDGYPRSWGKSKAVLQSKLTAGEELRSVKIDKQQILLFNPSGKKGDMLYLKFNRNVYSYWMTLLWQDKFNGKGQPFMSFWGGTDEFLIPLSTSCNYLLSDAPERLLLQYNDEHGSELKLLKAELFERRKR